MVNLLYCNIDETGIPIRNPGSWPSRLYQDLKNIDFKFSVSTLSDFDNSRFNVFPVELEYLSFDDIAEKISESVKHIINKFQIPILIYFPTEGFSLKRNNFWLNRISYNFFRNGFKEPLNVIFGNLEFEKNFMEFDKKFDNKEYRDSINELHNLHDYHFRDNCQINCFSLNYFEYEYYRNYQNAIDYNQYTREKVYVSEYKVFNPKKKKINFLSYNRNVRPSRLAFIYELFSKGLEKNSYLSFLGKSGIKDCRIDQSTLKATSATFGYPIKELEKFYDRMPNLYMAFETADKQANMIYSTHKNHFIDSFYSVVTETEIDDDTVFITEKTWKPIANLHPFLLWGNPGTLEYLRSLGYKTFSNMFDESYDKEKDPRIRLTMIIKEIKRFNKLPFALKYQTLHQERENIIHNRNHYLSRSQIGFRQDIENIFKQLQTDKLAR